jgi:hypothetical protein
MAKPFAMYKKRRKKGRDNATNEKKIEKNIRKKNQ